MNYPKELTPEHIAASTELYEELRKKYDISIAVVSGSLAFGLGHANSDIDFYVRTVEDVPIEGPDVHVFSGYSVQINLVTGAKLAKAIEWAGDDSDFTSVNRKMLDIQDDVRKFAIRLTRGHVIHVDEDGKRALSQLDRDVIRRRVITRQARDTGIHLEDIAGALQSDDIDTAYWAARIALTHACEAVMAGCDDVYVGRKFLLRRLRRLPALEAVIPQILHAFDVRLDGPSTAEEDGSDVVARIVRCAGLSAYLASSAILHGWEGKLSPLEPYRIGTEGPGRDPFHSLMRFGDGIALTAPDKGYRVGEDAACLWLSLDGTRAHTSFGTADSPTSKGVQKLLEIGAAHDGRS